MNSEPQLTEETEIYELNIVQSEYNHVYINELIQQNDTMNYDANVAIRLKNSFKASDIVYYSVESNCPFLGQGNRY